MPTAWMPRIVSAIVGGRLPPSVAVRVTAESEGAPVAVTIVSNGAAVDAGEGRRVGAGEAVMVTLPILVTATLAGDGLTISGQSDEAWIHVEAGKPGGPATMTARAPAVQVSFSEGRVWVRGVARHQPQAR